MKTVWVEVLDGKIVRIFRSGKTAWMSGAAREDRIKQVPKSLAVKEIRDQVFSQADGRCVDCGAPATEMHERVFKSRGGEVSIWNSVALCRDCHRGQGGAHPGPQWSRKDADS